MRPTGFGRTASELPAAWLAAALPTVTGALAKAPWNAGSVRCVPASLRMSRPVPCTPQPGLQPAEQQRSVLWQCCQSNHARDRPARPPPAPQCSPITARKGSSGHVATAGGCGGGRGAAGKRRAQADSGTAQEKVAVPFTPVTLVCRDLRCVPVPGRGLKTLQAMWGRDLCAPWRCPLSVPVSFSPLAQLLLCVSSNPPHTHPTPVPTHGQLLRAGPKPRRGGRGGQGHTRQGDQRQAGTPKG